MKKQQIIYFSFILLLFECSRIHEPIDFISKEEYAIYAIAIDSVYHNNSEKSVNILDSTDNNHYTVIAKFKKNGKWYVNNPLDRLNLRDYLWFKSDHEELTNDFNNKNNKHYKIDKDLIQSSKLLKQLQLDSLKNIFSSYRNGWQNFYKIYPNSAGIFIVSRVGFNSNRDQAVLYCEQRKEYLCAVGLYVLLYKENDKWRIKRIANDWVS